MTDTLAFAGALALSGAVASPAAAASVSRSVDVSGTPASVWAQIGSFCAIKDWHPAIGSCTFDNNTRTLVTRDGKATFVEPRTAGSDAEHFYSYTFRSSPVPVTQYASTFKVVASGEGTSTVTWSGTFTPAPGKEKDANDALAGIYETGLASIKTMLAR
jgi:Polyketide cyclase / dehydrase and lipid transport